mgnify:CR=1 FL=1
MHNFVNWNDNFIVISVFVCCDHTHLLANTRLHISDCIKYNLAGVNIVLQNPCEKTLYIKIKEAIACPFRFTGKKPGGNETWYSCDLQDVRWSMPRRLHRKTCNSSLSVAWFSTLPSLLRYWVLLIVRPDDALRCRLGGRVGARGPAKCRRRGATVAVVDFF